MKYMISLIALIVFCSSTPSFSQEVSKSIIPLHSTLRELFVTMLADRTFWVTGLGWITACSLKVVILKFKTGKFHIERFFATGGMPSSHSAFASCLTVGIGFSEGFTSAVFGLAMGLTILTAVDAVGLRQEAGLQAEYINKMLSDIYKDEHVIPDRLKETLGHSFHEVLAGIFVGSSVAFLINYML